MIWDNTLLSMEAEYTGRAVESLHDAPWAKPLLAKFNQGGGLKSSNLPTLFEIRFAYQMQRMGLSPRYEHSLGVGETTIDFHFCGNTDWSVELVSIGESDALKKATRQTEFAGGLAMSGRILETPIWFDGEDPEKQKQSEEGQMIKTQEKIGEKVYDRRLRKNVKFPLPPSQGGIHAILVDMRAYLGVIPPDAWRFHDDYRQITLGPQSVDRFGVHGWQGKPILGIFQKENPIKAARHVQERIHFVGFICEMKYEEDEIFKGSYWIPNLNLFSSYEDSVQAFRTFPAKIGMDKQRAGEQKTQV